MIFAALFFFQPFAWALEFDPSTAVWSALSLRSVNEGALNPGNRSARVPEQSLAAELRPDWRLTSSSWKLTARPRGIFSLDSISSAGGSSNDIDARLRWSEAFATWNASDSFSFDYGLQSFGWGPAESCSPSNRIFRDTVQAKDTLYLARGKHLARLSFTPSSSWSEVLLVEPSDNGEGEFEAAESFAAKAALKSELSWAGGSHFAGLVGGWRDRHGFWVGEYLNLEPLSGLFLYADASHERGSLASYPAKDSSGFFTVFSQNRKFERSIHSFLVTGLRYAFENGNDWRVEWIYHEAGYSRAELGSATASLTSTNPLQLAALAPTLSAARQPGLEFPSVHYLFSSLRFPNVFGTRDWSLYLRALRSLQDTSTAVFASSESAVGERGTFFASLGSGLGADTSELKGTIALVATLAYRHAW